VAHSYGHPDAYAHAYADGHLDPIAHPHTVVDGNASV
jgi:hypothetical protein